MNLDNFIKTNSNEDTPVGDLCNDILRDKSYPKNKSDIEKLEYLESKTYQISEIFEEFKTSFYSHDQNNSGFINPRDIPSA